ncbi:MAG: Glu/Leu/Phe/Val dehydrogenase [Cyclobacteriaceae bacterium]
MAASALKELESQSVFAQVELMDHEQVVFCQDKALGLKAIIAIHNTVLGPAMGGTRMWHYVDEAAAVTDALRLSRGMTFKSAIAGLNIGGGKAVIIGDAKKIKNEALMRRFGRFVDSLGGRYWTAEDVNMTTQDMEWIHMETPYVTGIPESMGGSGDPSPVTAYGVYVGMKAAAKRVYGSDDLSGKKVVVQGVGNVGRYLVENLVKDGAEIFITDMNEDKINALVAKHGVKSINMSDVYTMNMDIYAPCALGATLNSETIGQLKCAIVAGGANNQLADEEVDGRALIEKGILYAPDFLINGGGITNVYYEHTGNYNRQKVMEQTERIYSTCHAVWDQAELDNITPQASAMKLALQRINDIGKVKLPY